MKLFLSGTTEFNPQGLISAATLRVKAFLEASKEGEVFKTEQLEAKVKVHAASLTSRVAKNLTTYTHKIGSKRYWGKPSTIKQLIKETK